MTGGLSVGVDVTSVADVLASMSRFGQRYLDRVFTPHEQRTCSGAPEVRARGLAARFAAKEATIKALRPTDQTPPWTSIEMHKVASGWCEVRLSGVARDLAQRGGVEDLSVSFTHEKETATAVVVAVRSGEIGCQTK